MEFAPRHRSLRPFWGLHRGVAFALGAAAKLQEAMGALCFNSAFGHRLRGGTDGFEALPCKPVSPVSPTTHAVNQSCLSFIFASF